MHTRHLVGLCGTKFKLNEYDTDTDDGISILIQHDTRHDMSN